MRAPCRAAPDCAPLGPQLNPCEPAQVNEKVGFCSLLVTVLGTPPTCPPTFVAIEQNAHALVAATARTRAAILVMLEATFATGATHIQRGNGRVMGEKTSIPQSQDGIARIRAGNDGHGMVRIAADSMLDDGLALHFGFEMK
jgi:hypothetical protein